MNRYTRQGTPTFHSQSALRGRAATRSVPRTVRTQWEVRQENQTRAFRTGLILGVGIAAAAFALVLWLWVIPTMDAAVMAAQGVVA